MKKLFRLLISIFFAALALTIGHAKDNPNWSDNERKIAALLREYGHIIDHPGYPENHEYWDHLQWYQEQGDKVRPVLIFLIENEYKGDFDKMFNVLNGLNYSPGDKSDVVKFIRENISSIFKQRTEYGANGCIGVSLDILGEHGMPDDINIINNFRDDPDAMIRNAAKAALERMEQRIKSGDFSKKEPQNQRPDLEVDLGAKRQKPGTPTGANGPGNSKSSVSRWALIGSMVVLMISAGAWLKTRIPRR